MAAELAAVDDRPVAPGTGPKGATGAGVPPQLQPSEGLPERKAAARRRQRVLEMLHTLPPAAQTAIRKSLGQTEWSTGPGLSADRPAERPGWDGRADDQSGRSPVGAEHRRPDQARWDTAVLRPVGGTGRPAADRPAEPDRSGE